MKKIKVLMIVGMVSVMLAACGGRENEGGNEINASVSASEAQQDDLSAVGEEEARMHKRAKNRMTARS